MSNSSFGMSSTLLASYIISVFTSTATMSAVESLDGVKLPSKVSSNWLSLTSFRTVVYDGTQLTI
jgi:hypothetical protein